MSQFEKVREFHKAFGVIAPIDPALEYDPDVVKLRKNLIREEQEELFDALDLPDGPEKVIAVADALADLLYVVHGTGVSLGIPLDAVFDEVHDSNMSKLGDDGKP